jgi:hypothetical protein
MAVGRWYPSAIMLPDGRVLVVSGTSDDGELMPKLEIYNQLEGWQLLSEDSDRLLPLYPRMHVLPSGEVACLGNGQDLIFFQPDTLTWREIGDAGAIPHADDDLAVLPRPAQAAKILHTGGGAADDSGQQVGTAAAQIIDLNADAPAFRDIAPMANPRWFPNSAPLPDDTRFVCGGGRGNNADPVVTDAPASIAYGQNFSVSLLEPIDIASACFIRLSAVTHAFNMSQRYVALDFSQSDPQSVDIAALGDPNLAPGSLSAVRAGHERRAVRGPCDPACLRLVSRLQPELPRPRKRIPVAASTVESQYYSDWCRAPAAQRKPAQMSRPTRSQYTFQSVFQTTPGTCFNCDATYT